LIMKDENTKDLKEGAEGEDPLEFEDWDGQSPFWVHCLAGSLAGVAEHVSVYPLDTVKTHIQCAVCPRRQAAATTTAAGTAKTTSVMPRGMQANAFSNNNMWTTMRHLMSQPASSSLVTTATESTMSISRLFRGVQTMLVGCVPAHALYFSSYEATKWYFTDEKTRELPSHGGMAAGAAAVLGHDVVMTPLDTIKQRLQLGYYQSTWQAAQNMMQKEGGFLALYRSFPVTLLTNVPYGAIMVTTNEMAKQHFEEKTIYVYLFSASLGGMVASALTTPLDRIKTVLQIQQLQPTRACGSCPIREQHSPRALEWRQAWRQIVKQEGITGLWRGTLPRVLSHTPAVAISWTTYETAKDWLTR